MSKYTPTTFTSLENETSFLTTLNNNFATLATLLDTLVSRNGTSPNTITADIDMNSHRITNLAVPVGVGDPVRKQELDDLSLITYDNLQTAVDAAASIEAQIPTVAGYAASAAASAVLSASYVGAVTSAPTWTTPRTLSYTGDVTGSLAAVDGSANVSGALTIANNAVTTAKVLDANITNAKLANVATATFKGRTTAGTGAPEDLTVTQATALLNVVTGDSGSGGVKGLVPAPAAGDTAAGKYLKANGTWSAPTVAAPDLAGLVSSNQSLTSVTGYSEVGDLFFQAGTFTTATSAAGNQTLTFPTTFPNACIGFVAMPRNSGSSPGSQDTFPQLISKNTSQAVMYMHNNNGGVAIAVDWIAIGY